MRQNRARDAAPTPRAAWVARQGQSTARPCAAPAAASETSGAADATAPAAVPARRCRAYAENPKASVTCRCIADPTDSADATATTTAVRREAARLPAAQ